ncbi:MAG: 2-oxoglutarate dehydrogenase E1 component, partial [Deltaproteobacteria bacterium]|nr:2-oxoglutarate dehydrogenase E1 component [Deltaproteobacteria bacterium]
PHGYEGQGPEHSSARLERYLQACAQQNIQVCHPSLPAQFFHLVRRQMLRPFRLPLVILSPKSGLRHPQAVSSFDDFSKGSFEEVLDDPIAKKSAEALILTSGKMYYELLAERTSRELDVPLLRLEQFYPFPEEKLKTVLGKYKKLRELRWCQEEPQNMGGWNFVKENISRILDQRVGLKYVGRPPQASTSGGYTHVHESEQRMIAHNALGAL